MDSVALVRTNWYMTDPHKKSFITFTLTYTSVRQSNIQLACYSCGGNSVRQGWDVLYWIVIILHSCCNKLPPTTINQTAIVFRKQQVVQVRILYLSSCTSWCSCCCETFCRTTKRRHDERKQKAYRKNKWRENYSKNAKDLSFQVWWGQLQDQDYLTTQPTRY